MVLPTAGVSPARRDTATTFARAQLCSSARMTQHCSSACVAQLFAGVTVQMTSSAACAVRLVDCGIILVVLQDRRCVTGGEVDARACYTAMASAHMLGLDAPRIARDAGMVDFLRRCQARSLHTHEATPC